VVTAEHDRHGAHEVVLGVPRADGGRLCGRVDFTVHQQLVTERARRHGGGLAYVVDRRGEVVCHSFEPHEEHLHPGETLADEATRRASAGQAWHGLVERSDEVVIAAYAPASTIAWGVWTEVPVSAVATPVRRLTARALVLGALALVGWAGFVGWLSRSVVRPVQALARAAHDIARGDLGRTVAVEGDDELASLADEFNAMSAALQRAVHELDAEVADRTEALRNAVAFTEQLLDSVPLRVVVWSSEGRVVRSNEAAEAAGCPHVGDGDVVQEVLAHGVSERRRLTRARQRGPQIVDVRVVPVVDEHGRTSALWVEEDVTEATVWQAHMVHREKMAALGALAAGLAHEIGNPLASLSSELQLLALEPERVHTAQPVLVSQVDRMGRLLRELVALGRAPRDETGCVDVVQRVGEVVRLVRPTARERGVEIVFEPVERPVAETVADRLQQIVLNLMLNAVEACARRQGAGRVEVEVSGGDAGGLSIEVHDDGVGLPDGSSERLFEPGFTTRASDGGAGLGLFIVHELVSGLGGEVRADRRVPRGSTFRVWLPMRPRATRDVGGA
jgi:signal transduction histidine kinase